jgi:1-acyl-sn-glycerol-3-phosphate acyltransferase
MLNRLISLIWFIFVVATSTLFFVGALIIRVLTFPFDRRLRLLHIFTCLWASLYTYVVPPWRISLQNRDKIKKGATYIIVSNHQSQLDILVAFRLFRHFKWVSKAEIFKVPLIGWNMTLNRYIKLVRGSKDSAKQMLKESRERLDEGSSVYIFPEGTRSPTGKIKPFKPGAFILAHETRLPILPIVITGTNLALPKHSLNFHGTHDIALKVLDAVEYEEYKDLSIEQTADMVRDKIIQNS